MNSSIFRSRLLAIVLTLMISVTMAGGSFLEAFAVEGEPAAVNEEAGQTAQETTAAK